MAEDRKRLIEVDFPLQGVSIDSVHEKNVRHGHISTLHIWPARRPLAACRAALIATLLPDPGNDEERKAIYKRLAGELVKVEKKGKVKTETKGGILHWKRETENAKDVEWFRDEIRKAYDGRAPKVLDPFAGGGAIPLEAMRLGCEATAIDINPVAWFLLKCTLEYPQKLAGQTSPLPDFAVSDHEFMESYFKKSKGLKGKNLTTALEKLGFDMKSESLKKDWKQIHIGESEVPKIEADLAWHVRAWGMWVLEEARKELASYYPVIDGKPTVAYLWARTVECKNCRATVPLLKTRWLCKRDHKRVVLTMEPNEDKTGVIFGIDKSVPVKGGNAAQKREFDKQIGSGTMNRSGVTCPCCGTIMAMGDLRFAGKADKLDAVMTAVVVSGDKDKEYRLPVPKEIDAVARAKDDLDLLYKDIPFGMLVEQTPIGGSGASRAFSVEGFGLDEWNKIFTSRQLLSHGTIAVAMRKAQPLLAVHYPPSTAEAIRAILCTTFDRITDYGSTITHWQSKGEHIVNTFQRYALQISWDFTEANPLSGMTGSYMSALGWTQLVLSHFIKATEISPTPIIKRQSATESCDQNSYDLVLTDPPYYDAIPYSSLMDFFYIWLRRTLHGLSPKLDNAFKEPLSPKWDHEANDGELIDDSSRFNGDKHKSKQVYEAGMARAFAACHTALKPDGRLVIVFAHKHPDAWETLVAAIIKSGFVVTGSWPIQTERGARARAIGSAALASSIWLVCRKRDPDAKAGWDNAVLEEMRENITDKLRRFWNDGIHGPDFVWSATGPALEAYSKHPVVKKTDKAGELMTVGEFLIHVRRIVVNFIVGNVLGSQQGTEVLDEATTYYLLHRHEFGTDAAPAGAVILYATACGLTDADLTGRFDILASGKASSKSTDEDENGDESVAETSGSSGSKSEFKLQAWNKRTGKNLGLDTKNGRPIPLIDQLHKLMHLWKAADVGRVNNYIDERRIQRNELFKKVMQALIELSTGSERAMLESISNHLKSRGDSATTLFDK